MTQNAAHKQNIQWLKEQLAQQESKLARAEALGGYEQVLLILEESLKLWL